MKIEKKIHSAWINPEQSKKLIIPNVIGKFQYIFSSQKGRISLIKLTNYFRDGKDLWEIYSSGTLFEDIERFDSKKEAEIRIKEFLD